MAPREPRCPVMSTAAQAMSRAALEDKLFAAKLKLMGHDDYIRWSGVMTMGSTYLVDSIPTAMTDGRNEWYGTEFVRELGVRELRFVILHENLHKMARHLIVWEDLHKEDPELANQACDHWINLTLHDLDPVEKFTAHPRREGERMGCHDPRFRGMDTKQIFDILKQEKQNQAGQAGPAGFDTHDWEGASKLTEKEKEQLSKDVDRAMRQGAAAAHRAGVGSDGSSRLFGQLLAPKVDWREQLRQFVSSNTRAKDVSSWRKVNRRLVSEGIYLPSLIGERVRSVVVGVDTSGSIGSKELTAFLSEVAGIAEGVQPEKLHLFYWDSHVAGHEVYGVGGSSLSDLRLSTKPAGGGGTDPRCVIEAIAKLGDPRPDCVVMLTDGYITDWGVWPSGVPLLWVVCGSGGRNIMAPVGQTIHMDN
ncbi:VWA-like domain containing protein [uncultured Caudovirales phage]|uniref:VWA-like domain containing protein n=1 Tax=uncultured Caudovirales phage TaxID=2100421 RepID=A0A6J7X7G9_9CAUD|nr:VWA-like domain containing protein [uncultured Caudovirales phage]CAB4167675.1 VWA-like domain containing protein [uncultured Caudovirales phage]CAB4168361.1 VWA-like domain containing protein [uncultured Caudovirales phage]CAB4181767.1 VWA-like domain containing protein [uncultured Caudovirales phage]CAB4195387.1 VWA-like domain containing protein [uncultured Caudovirales phage]